jgi:hypothetical protein
MITEQVIERLTTDTKELFDFYDKKNLYKTKKQKSEDISGLLENAMAELIEGAVAPKIDAEPDIRLHGEPVEIKTTSGETWFSGTFSKREGYFIFLHWLLKEDNNVEFFIAGKDLKKDDWTASKSKSYYATTYDKKKLYANIDDWDIFKGHLEAYDRGKQTCIKIHTGQIEEEFLWQTDPPLEAFYDR